MCFTGDGPSYLHVETVKDSETFRRVRNLYYNREFAELLYREALLCHAKAGSSRARCLKCSVT